MAERKYKMNRTMVFQKKFFLYAALLILITLTAGLASAESRPEDFTCSNGVIRKYNGNDSIVSIPSVIDGQPVTAIGQSAFYNNKSIISVTVPEGVQVIHDNAFAWCQSLRSISLPSTLTELKEKVFYCCSSLEKLTIPPNVTTIGTDLIFYCKRLRLVQILSPSANFDEGTFIKSGTSSWASNQTPVYSAPAGSNTFQKLEQYGCRCAGTGTLSLNHTLSTNPSNRTRIPALDNQPLDLDNSGGVTVLKVIDYYSRSDWERNDSSWTDYQIESEVTGNQWTYSGDGRYWDTSDLLLLCRDASGNDFWAGPFYVRYGIADLNEPKILSPILSTTQDGYPYVPYADLNLSWVASEDAEYDLILFEDSGISLWGIWWSKNLPGNSGTVPASELKPQDPFYQVLVKVRSKTTGESVGSKGTGYFKVYGTNLVSEQAVITQPIPNAPMANETWAPYISVNGDLTVQWQKVPNAVSYQVILRNHIPSGGFFTLFDKPVTAGTQLTVPRARFETDSTQLFSLSVVAYDEYGGCTGDTSFYYFRMLNDTLPNVKAGGTSLTTESGNWTPVSSGETVLSWSAATDADQYETYLVRYDGKKYSARQETVSGSTCRLSVSLDQGCRYIFCLKSMKGSDTLSCGWYYMDAGLQKAPVILSPTAAYTTKEDIHVEWTDTGADRYSVGLFRKNPGDSNEEYDVFGDPLPYYSETVKELSGLTSLSCDFSSSLLEYGGMYRILVTAYYPGGVTTGTDFLFKTEGDPAACPVVSGATTGEQPDNPPENIRCGSLKAVWPAGHEWVSYEMSLYTVSETGLMQDLVHVSSGTATELTIPASALKAGNTYMLLLRAYDSDHFSSEHRRYFSIADLSAINALVLPSGLQRIGEEAWSNDSRIVYAVIPDGVTEIGNRAFSGCTSLLCIDIPESVTKLGTDLFSGCTDLTICAPQGSAAAAYAESNGIPWMDP